MPGSIHGGDVYSQKINIDYSVSVNPLGTPKSVLDAISGAVKNINRYPDYNNTKALDALSEYHGINKDNILLGNGSSELFMAVARAFESKKVLLPIPSFSGYQYALDSYEKSIEYIDMLFEEDRIIPDEKILALIKDADMFILGNPNNPTGKLIDKDLLKKIADECEEKDTIFVLDECFIDFCEGGNSLINEFENYKNLLIIRSFTKNYTIPGVRVGYLVCSDKEKIKKIKKQIPEWNISSFASEAAVACCREKDFLKDTLEYTKSERERLKKELENLGIKVYESDSNFMLLKADEKLAEGLLKKNILIRNCSNFKGLTNEHYRIAIKSREEDDCLIEAIKGLRAKDE